jgi:hypothetical protein
MRPVWDVCGRGWGTPANPSFLQWELLTLPIQFLTPVPVWGRAGSEATADRQGVAGPETFASVFNLFLSPYSKCFVKHRSH